jgi:heme O synthase-like polyprenyltransferase
MFWLSTLHRVMADLSGVRMTGPIGSPVLAGSGLIYAVGALLLGLNFLRHAIIVLRSDEPKLAMRMFGYSILYLFALFALLLIDHFMGAPYGT